MGCGGGEQKQKRAYDKGLYHGESFLVSVDSFWRDQFLTVLLWDVRKALLGRLLSVKFYF